MRYILFKICKIQPVNKDHQFLEGSAVSKKRKRHIFTEYSLQTKRLAHCEHKLVQLSRQN